MTYYICDECGEMRCGCCVALAAEKKALIGVILERDAYKKALKKIVANEHDDLAGDDEKSFDIATRVLAARS